jgi:hypothetical protein
MDIFSCGGFILSFGGGTGLRGIARLLGDDPGDSKIVAGADSGVLLAALVEGPVIPFPMMSGISEYLRWPLGWGVWMTVSDDSCAVISG